MKTSILNSFLYPQAELQPPNDIFYILGLQHLREAEEDEREVGGEGEREREREREGEGGR